RARGTLEAVAPELVRPQGVEDDDQHVEGGRVARGAAVGASATGGGGEQTRQQDGSHQTPPFVEPRNRTLRRYAIALGPPEFRTSPCTRASRAMEEPLRSLALASIVSAILAFSAHAEDGPDCLAWN